jgi:beta-N-acetylhexosaminidase
MRALLAALGLAVVAAVVVVVVTLSSGSPVESAAQASGESAGAPSVSEAPPASQSEEAPSPAPSCEPAPLDQRVGQAIVVGLPGATSPDDPVVDEILEYDVGGILITDANVASAAQVRSLIEGIRQRSDVPLLVTTDEEPGRVTSFEGIVGSSPSARELALTRPASAVRDFAEQLGTAIGELGVEMDLAPVADLYSGRASGVIGDRSFSKVPEAATDYSLAFSRGLAEAGVAPTAKHFPGHGRSPIDSHRRLGQVEAPLSTLRETDLVPFRAQIEAGVPAVMTSNVAYTALDPELPASLAPETYELLREDMGFKGVAITDSLGMGAVTRNWPFQEAAWMALAAGADAALATPGQYTNLIHEAVRVAVRDGRLPESRLNEAVGRMLALKGADPSSMVCGAAVEAGQAVPEWQGRLASEAPATPAVSPGQD